MAEKCSPKSILTTYQWCKSPSSQVTHFPELFITPLDAYGYSQCAVLLAHTKPESKTYGHFINPTVIPGPVLAFWFFTSPVKCPKIH